MELRKASIVLRREWWPTFHTTLSNNLNNKIFFCDSNQWFSCRHNRSTDLNISWAKRIIAHFCKTHIECFNQFFIAWITLLKVWWISWYHQFRPSNCGWVFFCWSFICCSFLYATVFSITNDTASWVSRWAVLSMYFRRYLDKNTLLSGIPWSVLYICPKTLLRKVLRTKIQSRIQLWWSFMYRN